MAANSPVRGKLIRILHTGKSVLGWDDETYRAAMARLTGGKTSSKACSIDELKAVLEHMYTSGFPRSSARHGRVPNVASRRQGILSKIQALLSDAGHPWSYAESMARHMFSGRQAIEWLTDSELKKLMQALIIDQRRRVRRAGPQEER